MTEWKKASDGVQTDWEQLFNVPKATWYTIRLAATDKEAALSRAIPDLVDGSIWTNWPQRDETVICRFSSRASQDEIADAMAAMDIEFEWIEGRTATSVQG